MAQKQLTKSAAADRLGVSPKQIERYVHQGMPCAGLGRDRRFPWPEIRRWRDDLLQQQARDEQHRARPADLHEARARKEAAQADLAELQRDQLRAKLIPLDVHEERVAALCDRLAAVCKGGLSRYAGDIQRATTHADAMILLERVGDDLLRALAGEADEIEADATPPEPEESDDAAA